MSVAENAPARSGAPAIFRIVAFAVPVLIALQFFLVGLAIFADGGAWELHRTNGALIGLPVLAAFAMPLAIESLRGFRVATARVLALYVLQFVWLELGEATGLGVVQALHALNAIVLMGQSANIAERVAGRR